MPRTDQQSIPNRVWTKILREHAQGMSYAALAAKWGPQIEADYGVRLTARAISNRAQSAPEAGSAPARRTSGSRDLWTLIEEFWAKLPPDAAETLPTDGADEHDHYIYGTPKRNGK